MNAKIEKLSEMEKVLSVKEATNAQLLYLFPVLVWVTCFDTSLLRSWRITVNMSRTFLILDKGGKIITSHIEGKIDDVTLLRKFPVKQGLVDKAVKLIGTVILAGRI